MSKSLIPKSKAKTAYSLLSEIAKLIIAEPKRYNQERFLTVRGGREQAPRGFPACGTVGCVAGWVAALKGPKGARTRYQDVQTVATDILGLDHYQSDQLFSGSALSSAVDGLGPNPQTVSHARHGVKHIRRFQEANRAQLLAKRIR